MERLYEYSYSNRTGPMERLYEYYMYINRKTGLVEILYEYYMYVNMTELVLWRDDMNTIHVCKQNWTGPMERL